MSFITATNLINSNGGVATSYTTASISPIINQLVLVSVTSRASAAINTPTVTGASMTWTAVQTELSGDGLSQLTVFRALSSSPGSGALTIDFAGQSQQYCNWSVDQFKGIVISGSNGANAIVQTAVNTSATTRTGITATLGAFSSPDNATFGVVGTNHALPVISVGTNFTQLGSNASNGQIVSEFAATNQTAVNFIWTSDNPIAMVIGIELAAFPANGGFLYNFLQ